MNAGMHGLPGGAQARRVIGLINYSTDSGFSGIQQVAAVAGAKNFSTSLSGAGFQNALSISGRGCVNWLGVGASSSASFDIQVLIDGETVRTLTAVTIGGGGDGGRCIVGGGQYSSTAGLASAVLQPIYFNSSLVVMLKPSIAVTAYVLINAEIHA